MNKPVYLDPSILEISKTVIHAFWYDYLKPNMEKKQNYVTWIKTAL